MAFASFKSQTTAVSSGAHIASYYRRSPHSGGDGNPPILVLLHGYPQNSLMWKRFIDEIPLKWTIYVPDLPSYGASTKQPSPAGDSLAHSKREWAKDIIEAVDIVHGDPSSKIIPYGHDRGGRLAYRLALDFPQRVAGVGVLEIVPTPYVWDAMRPENGHALTRGFWHWIFLSSPAPFPERLISSRAEWFYTEMFLRWTSVDTRTPVSVDWVSDSIKPYADPSRGKDRIIGSCEDYRAGATHDLKHDLESGLDPTAPTRAFQVPLLVLSAAQLRRRHRVDEIWECLAPEGFVRSLQIGDDATGHFIVNEEQEQVGHCTREWLKEHWG